MAVERVLSNLNLISFKTEGGLQNHIDELQDGDLVFTPDNSLKGNLFDFKWTDHKLNDISWLNADTFSWQSGDVYVAAYNHLVNEVVVEGGNKKYIYCKQRYQTGDDYRDDDNKYYRAPEYDNLGYVEGFSIAWKSISSTIIVVTNTETPVESDMVYYLGADYLMIASGKVRGIGEEFVSSNAATETIGGITITYYQAEDGHKICPAGQEANVQALYEKTGVAWYYILDTANKQFKLPRTKFGFTGLRDSVGGYIEAGLPNITGSFGGLLNHPNFKGSGSFASAEQAGSANSGYATTGNYESKIQTTSFDASRSSSVYGNSNTVQPKATQMYLYFYVGNFERDALEQTAGLNAEMFNDKADVSLLENKANTDLSNIPSAYDYVVASQEPTSANAYTWYRKYKSGWVEQGRYYVNPDATWVLPIPMANSNYVITASYISSESTNTSQWRFMGITKTATTVTPAVSGLAQSIYICGMAA